jgi:hypothetical protein
MSNEIFNLLVHLTEPEFAGLTHVNATVDNFNFHYIQQDILHVDTLRMFTAETIAGDHHGSVRVLITDEGHVQQISNENDQGQTTVIHFHSDDVNLVFHNHFGADFI